MLYNIVMYKNLWLKKGGVMKDISYFFKKCFCVLMVSLVYILSTEDPTESETLNITTYYPAPYGGYVSLLTTNNTYLARDNGGSVGIGTTTPGQKLDVNGGNIRATGEIISTLQSGSGQFRAIAGSYGAFIRNDGSDTYIPLLTAGGDQYGGWNSLRPLRINNASGDVYIANGQVIMVHSNGNVGLGIWPSYKLDVNGDVRILGTLYGLCTWRTDDGGYYWHGCAGGEWIMGFNPQGWANEGVCGGNVGGQCAYGGTRLVPTWGYMLCCRMQ